MKIKLPVSIKNRKLVDSYMLHLMLIFNRFLIKVCKVVSVRVCVLES